jgi:hypothetical protein
VEWRGFRWDEALAVLSYQREVEVMHSLGSSSEYA